jgi:hypothetical protein
VGLCSTSIPNRVLSGRVGIALALPGGTQFSAGSRRIARAVFTVRSVRAGSSALTFDDVPVVREVVNGGAKEMAAAYGPGAILIATGAPEIHIAVEGSSLVVTWPASASGFVLESSPAIQSPVWAAVGPQTGRTGASFPGQTANPSGWTDLLPAPPISRRNPHSVSDPKILSLTEFLCLSVSEEFEPTPKRPGGR